MRPSLIDAAELPSPLRAASPYAVTLAATALMAAGGAITRQWAVALAAASLLAGAVRDDLHRLLIQVLFEIERGV